MRQKLHALMLLLLAVLCGGVSYGQTTVTDDLTAQSLGLTTKYAVFDGKKISSSAEYTGVACKNSTYIQMKYDSKTAHSGIYTTKSGGVAKSITVTFNSTGKGKVKVVAQKTAFVKMTEPLQNVSGATELSTGNSSTFTYEFSEEDEYPFVGIQAENSNTVKIDKITIVWKTEGTPSDKTSTSLSFEKEKYTFVQGEKVETFTNPLTMQPAEVGTEEVTYSSDNENIAVVDKTSGEVLVSTDQVGTATITATYAGDDTYAPSAASYTIQVKKAVQTVEDGVFDFCNPQGYGYPEITSGGTAMPEGTEVKAGNVTLKVLKKGTSDAGWWYDGVWRIYKNSEHELSVPDGYVITSVTIVPVSSSKDNYAIQGGNEGENWTGASQQVTIVNDENNNSQIKSITVKYVKLESLTTTAAGFATYAADYPVNYSELGLKAYAVKVKSDNSGVTYSEYAGIVPANSAVLVKGKASQTYALTPFIGESSSAFDTDLKAVTEGGLTITAENHDLIYAFGTSNETSGFKHVKTGSVIPAKKGYLKIETAVGAKDFYAFDDTVTGIHEAPSADVRESKEPLYNLAGQRVANDYKGIVVKNGKKFVNK